MQQQLCDIEEFITQTEALSWKDNLTTLKPDSSSTEIAPSLTLVGNIISLKPIPKTTIKAKERNARSFEDCETGLIKLKKLVIQTLLMWRVKIQSMSKCSYSDFLDMCSLFSLN
jgi:hypothetical protein